MPSVTRCGLRDFRNYERAELHVGPGLTVIAGPNGAGKTNLLEALYFGLTGRSCRTSNERELVRMGASVARVELEVEADDGRHLLEVGFEPGQEKRMRAGGGGGGSPAALRWMRSGGRSGGAPPSSAFPSPPSCATRPEAPATFAP